MGVEGSSSCPRMEGTSDSTPRRVGERVRPPVMCWTPGEYDGGRYIEQSPRRIDVPEIDRAAEGNAISPELRRDQPHTSRSTLVVRSRTIKAVCCCGAGAYCPLHLSARSSWRALLVSSFSPLFFFSSLQVILTTVNNENNELRQNRSQGASSFAFVAIIC